MERKNNYLIQREEARKRFQNMDQNVIINMWNLKNDKEWIYLNFLGREYRISRSEASVWRRDFAAGKYEEAGFEEVLSIFDLLTHQETRPVSSGSFAPVNSLKGGAKTIGVGTRGLYSTHADQINRDSEKFCKASESLGAKRIPVGDIGYEFTVFQDLQLRLKFYYADEEFPAQVVCLWDENALSYMYYETTFYVMGFLYESVLGSRA